MSIRTRLKQLELRASREICIKDQERDALTDWIRGESGKKWALCQCPDCREKRRERDADPTSQEMRRFIDRRLGLGATPEEGVTQ